MPKKKRNDSGREQEILTSPVRVDGVGEDPAVRAVLSDEFVKGTNEEALDIALALQQLIRGQNSLLENDRKFSDELNKFRAQMAKYDEDARRFEQDRQRWLDEIETKADALRASDAQVEKMKAKAAIELAAKVTEARAMITLDRAQFDAALEREPKETIVSPGKVETIMENGAPVAKLYPEELRVKHRRWVLPPGVSVEVPQSIARLYRDRKLSAQETAERQQAMMQNLESGELSRRMKEIDEKYHSSTARLGEN